MAAKLSDPTLHTSEICWQRDNPASPGQAGVARMPCAAPLILSICLSACYIMQAADIRRPTVVLLTGLTEALGPLYPPDKFHQQASWGFLLICSRVKAKSH